MIDDRLLALVACPHCRGTLREEAARLACEGCGRDFPVVGGIPDLRRGYVDAYATVEGDLADAARLHELSARGSFADLLREHWRMTGKPAELAERFLAGDLATHRRSEAYVAAVEARRGALTADDRFLEVGCGTAGLAGAAAGRAGTVVASDVSMRWLVLARRRLEEAGGANVLLVCCAAEHPPFRPGVFDVVGASDVIEHAASQPAFVAGCAQTLRRGGTLFLATPNRFSLGLEPHVRLWGVGWLPRRLAPRYVERVRGAPYDHVRLLSNGELQRLLRAHGLAPVLDAPEIPAATRSLYRGVELRLVELYNWVRRLDPVHRVLLRVGPFFHVFATKE